MKPFFLICSFLLTQMIIAQTEAPKMINFYLKNTQLLPKKVTLIGYSPGVSGNSTYGYILFPGIKRAVSYTVGTKLYLASSRQVGVVMSGNRIDKDPPFLVVGASNANKIIKVN